MRVCRSYLSLMARSTLYKELALFVVMAVVELALFIPNLEKQFSEVVGIGENGEEIYFMYSLPVDEIAENTHLQWVWIAALVLLSLILIRTAGRWRARKLALWPVRYAVLLAAVGLPGCVGFGHVSAVPTEPAGREGDGADGPSQYLSHAVLL